MKLKKLLLFLLLCICLINVEAYTYSEWSTLYPTGYEDFLIESEVRYKWYKEKREDVEYLPKYLFEDKSYDLNDYIYTELSEENIIYPEEKEDRIISSESKMHNFTTSDIDHIVLNELLFYGGMAFSEIDIYKISTNERIEYTFDKVYDANDSYGVLNDDNTIDYLEVNSPMKISINLNKYYDGNDLMIKIKYKSLGEGFKRFQLEFKHTSGFTIIHKTVPMDECKDNCELTLMNDGSYNIYLSYKVPHYRYKDKLYKTYNIIKEYEEGYYKELDGYIKDEESFITYYRHIISPYYFINSKGEFIESDRTNYCDKNYCMAVFINHDKEEEIIINPKTNDNINYSYYIIIISLIALIISSILIIKKYREKCRMNK